MSVVTPMQVEARLKDLSKLIDEAHDDLVNTESLYQQHKADYEIAMARTRLELSQKSSPTGITQSANARIWHSYKMLNYIRSFRWMKQS